MSATKTRSAAFAALLVAGALVLAGCGGGGDSSTESTASKEATSSQQGDSASAAAIQDQQDKQGSSPAQATEHHFQDKTSSSAKATKHGKHVALPQGEPEPPPTPAQRAQATVADVILTSPSLGTPGSEGVASLPARYTCAGADTWPALRWNGVPAGTRELVLFVLAQEPVDEALFFNWAVAGIDPATTAIESGRLPAGAVVGRNSFGRNGYSVCPPNGPETYLFALYALPGRLAAARGFDPAALREKALGAGGSVGLLAVVGG